MSCGCDEALAKLHLLLDREIDSASCDEIQAHIDSCVGCLHEYDLERVVKLLVSRSCTEQAPEVLRQRVLISIRSAMSVEFRQ